MKDYKRLGDYIREVNVRNRELEVKKLVGLTIDKAFIPSVANVIGTDLSNYKIIQKEQFACSLMQVSRDGKMPVAMFEEDQAIMSPAYPMFEVIDKTVLLPQYLMMWFSRSEFDREASYYAVGGVRGSLTWEDFCNMRLPIPSIERQREIVAEYDTLTHRIRLNEQMIQYLEDTAQALYRKMFVNGVDKENLPDGWRIGTIEELSEFIIAGVIPQYVENSEYKVLGQRCVHDHIIDINFAKLHNPKANCLYLKDGDILINSTGSGTLGRAGQIFNTPENLTFDSNMTLVRPKFDFIIDYLGITIFDKEEYFIQISQGSTNQTRLYCSMVKHIEIIIPSGCKLREFKNYARPMRIEMEYKKQENSKLEELQSLLLAKMGQ